MEAPPSTLPSPRGGPDPSPSFGRQTATPGEEQQRLYDGLVRMLCLLGNADSRALLEQAYHPGPP